MSELRFVAEMLRKSIGCWTARSGLSSADSIVEWIIRPPRGPRVWYVLECPAACVEPSRHETFDLAVQAAAAKEAMLMEQVRELEQELEKRVGTQVGDTHTEVEHG